MDIDTVLRSEMSNLNKNLIRRRKNLKDLLDKPIIEESSGNAHLNIDCLMQIAQNCNLPMSSIMLPITFFVPAGLYEGYILSEEDARVVTSLGVKCQHRSGKYWVSKHEIRELEHKFSGCFQSMIMP